MVSGAPSRRRSGPNLHRDELQPESSGVGEIDPAQQSSQASANQTWINNGDLIQSHETCG